MKNHSSRYNKYLDIEWKIWLVSDNSPFILPHTKSTLNHTSKRWVRMIKIFISSSRASTSPLKFLKMVWSNSLSSLGIQNQLHNISLEKKNSIVLKHKKYVIMMNNWLTNYKPGGGCRKLLLCLQIVSRKMKVSCVAPSHPSKTNVNNISKSHATITFWVGYPFLPKYGIDFSVGTTTTTCVSSIALMQS